MNDYSKLKAEAAQRVDFDLIAKISTFIREQQELPETYDDVLEISVNNQIVEYLKQNPIIYHGYDKDGTPFPPINISDLVRKKIMESVRWTNHLKDVFIKTYLRVKEIDNIPSRAEETKKNLIEKKYETYKNSLKTANLHDLREALAVLLYNTEIEDVPYNVTRILYGVQRVQMGHPNPKIGSTSLFFFSTSQGNGKTTLCHALLKAAKNVGLNADTTNIEKLSRRNFADVKNPLDRIHILCQPSFLKESKSGFDRTVLELLIDGEPIVFDQKFKNYVKQRFNGLIVIGGNGIPKVGDRRYSVIHLIEDSLAKFHNKPSVSQIEKAWEYLLTHVVSENIFEKLIPWQELNNQKGIQNTSVKSDLYNLLVNLVENQSYEIKMQVQSILAKFNKTLLSSMRSGYKAELKKLVENGVIRCEGSFANCATLVFSKQDLSKLDYGDDQKFYDYVNHVKYIHEEIERFLPDDPEPNDEEWSEEYNNKPDEFIEWGQYNYDPNGEFQILNLLRTTNVADGYKTPRIQKNCFMRRFLYESDNTTLAEQKAILDTLIQKKLITRAVYSGSKSVHMIVEIDNDCQTVDEYKYFWKEIAKDIGLDLTKLDSSCADNCRLTRRPGIMRYLGENKFNKYVDDAIQLFDPKIDPLLFKIEQKLVYQSNDIYKCYYDIKERYIKSKMQQEPIVAERIVSYIDDKPTDINKFIINYTKKNMIDLDFSQGNGHSLFGTIIGACKTRGFSPRETEDWLREHCDRFNELYEEWKNEL